MNMAHILQLFHLLSGALAAAAAKASSDVVETKIVEFTKLALQTTKSEQPLITAAPTTVPTEDPRMRWTVWLLWVVAALQILCGIWEFWKGAMGKVHIDLKKSFKSKEFSKLLETYSDKSRKEYDT
ncbi:hypothetical protein DE146DRAFT_437299 [Phaeosphaeria sp. MPI-PUGE-AT-0046c]|nr:hypothetical protein DE146DRAFT_437299 [Phaeosphaeria sp. MPI-PUGE-AT-0046c]